MLLAIGGFWLHQLQKRREEQAIEQRAELERELARNNQEAILLQAYIDTITELLLEEHLGELTADGKLKSEYEQVRKIARVRTITLLAQLDAGRIGYVFAFLREAGLMSSTRTDNVVSLSDAHLRAVNWSRAILSNANLRGANLTVADLSYADLEGANLSEAFLFHADLSEANLYGANLEGARLMHAFLLRAFLISARLKRAFLNQADLSGANLTDADLQGANLEEADLSGADLQGANLSQANLSKANLREANITPEQLKQVKFLKGATMPDGSKHP
jgi:uncharacterized protein YjbI with pentapeptide repeats